LDNPLKRGFYEKEKNRRFELEKGIGG